MTGGHDHYNPHEYPEFPRKYGYCTSRKHTDFKWCLIFLVYAGLMAAAVVWSFWNGEIVRLTRGADHQGRVCGIHPDVADKSYLYWCGTADRQGDYPKRLTYESTTCLQSCPTNVSQQIDCLMPAYHNFSNYVGGTVGTSKNIETLQVTITQSVSKQLSYPTTQFGGRFCLPADQGLRQEVVNGPWGVRYRAGEAVGSLTHSWILLIIVALVATLLGFIYLWMMKDYAGPAIFITMFLSSLITLVAAIFFLIAIFFNGSDEDGLYQKTNPFWSVYTGGEAKMYSALLGLFLLFLTCCFCGWTWYTVAHVDEIVGLVDAAIDCIQGVTGCGLGIGCWPLIASIAFIALVGLLFFFGLPRVMSLGYLDLAEISINDRNVDGLRKEWKRHWTQWFALWFYIIGSLWVLEMIIQLGHFIVAHSVCSWYFIPTVMSEFDHSAEKKKWAAMGVGDGRYVDVRVGGVDDNYGRRHGVVKETAGGKVLVVPVEKKGPGLGRNELLTETHTKPPGARQCSWVSGFLAAMWYHLGSLAFGSIIIALLRPFRLFSQCLSSFLAKSGKDARQGQGYDDNTRQDLWGCLSLVTQGFEVAFCKYSKMVYTAQVLNGVDDWCEAAQESWRFVSEGGGTLAYLHGAMFIYELFGIICITCVSTLIANIILTSVPAFSNEDSDYYIEDRAATLFFAAVISGIIGFAWMMLFNHTSDVLLYCVGWNRWQHHLSHASEEDMEVPGDPIWPVKNYCPDKLNFLIPDYERSSEWEHGLHTHGLNQQAMIARSLEQNSAARTYAGTAAHGHGGGHTASPGLVSTMMDYRQELF